MRINCVYFRDFTKKFLFTLFDMGYSQTTDNVTNAMFIRFILETSVIHSKRRFENIFLQKNALY